MRKIFIVDDLQMPSDLIGIPEPRIVYTGVVYNRFDEKLFYEVVDANPDKSFVVIGPYTRWYVEGKKEQFVYTWAQETFGVKELFEIYANWHSAIH